MTFRVLLGAALTAFAHLVTPPGAVAADVENIVLVHGMNMDGGSWRQVHERLISEGYHVTVVQLPLTSIEDDLAAARRAIASQNGPMVLVGHSYGGLIISETGAVDDVTALVYVAAFLPDVGESAEQLQATAPGTLAADTLQIFPDGHYLVDRSVWIEDVANGLPDHEAQYTADFQTPGNIAIFGYQTESAAWREKPSFAFIATDDRVILPDLQRRMAERAGATVLEFDSGHLPLISHPDAVADFIVSAATSAR